MTSWSASSGYMSVGVDLSYSGDPSSGYVTVRAIVTARSDGYGHSFSSQWSWWGDSGAGSEGFSFSSPFGGTVHKTLSDWTFQASTRYGEARWIKVGASLGPIWNGGNPSVEGWIQIPARPYSAPSAPTGVKAQRQSETQALVAWALPGASAAAPVQQIGVQRRSLRDPQWKQMVWLTDASATSWTDTAVPANDRVEYRVQTWNSGGYSAHADATSAVTSSVAAPSGVRAAKDASGNIVVSWDANYPGGGIFEVVDNGVKVGEAPVVSGAAHSFTHLSPDPQVTHTYTVKHIDGGVSSLPSTPSPTVQLLAKPNAPKILRPSAAVPSGAVLFEWQHNPVDSTSQKEAEIRYRARGAASWTTRRVTTARQLSVVLVAGSYEWQARTKGLHEEFSAWSPVSSFTVADVPTVAISSPAPKATINRSRCAVEWSFYQAQGAGQSAAEAELLDASGRVLETIQVSGAVTSAVFSTPLEDASSYMLRARVRSGHGLWSIWVSSAFSVSFPAPPVPKAEASWEENEGAATISITNAAPLDPSQDIVNLARNGRGKVQGSLVEVRRNYAVAPNGDDSLADGELGIKPLWGGEGARWSSEIVTDPVDAPEGVRAYVLKRWSSIGSALGDVGFQFTNGAGKKGFAVAPGESWSVSAYMRSSRSIKPIYAKLALLPANASGEQVTPWLYPSEEVKQLVGGVWERFSGTFTIPEGVAYINPVIYLGISLDEWSTSDTLACGGLLVEKDQPVLPFFDGAFSPDEDMIPAWTGKTGASASTLSVVRPAWVDKTNDNVVAAVSKRGGIRVLRVKEGNGFAYQSLSAIENGVAVALGLSMRSDDPNAVVDYPVVAQSAVSPWVSIVRALREKQRLPEGRVVVSGTTPSDSAKWDPSASVSLVLRAPTVPWTSIWYDEISFIIAQTEDEAKRIAAEYFDGDMGPNVMVGGQSYAVSWDGGARGSSSTAVPNSPAAVSNLIERSVDEGVSWEVVAEGVAVSSSVIDRESLSAGMTLYRVSAMTDLPSSSSALVELHADSDAVWISGGDGFSVVVPLGWDPQHSTGVGLVNRKVHHFAGRRLGVEMSGKQRQRAVSVSATLLDERLDLIRRLEELSYLPAPFLYRDPLGRRFYASLSGVQMDRAVGGKWSVSAALEEVDR